MLQLLRSLSSNVITTVIAATRETATLLAAAESAAFAVTGKAATRPIITARCAREATTIIASETTARPVVAAWSAGETATVIAARTAREAALPLGAWTA
jgi:hypothetical protein